MYLIKRNNQEAQTTIASFKLFHVQDVTYAISICEDSRLRIWNLKTCESTSEDLSRYLIKNEAIIWGLKQKNYQSSFYLFNLKFFFKKMSAKLILSKWIAILTQLLLL